MKIIDQYGNTKVTTNATTLTTKGDLLTFDSALQRLAVGSNGQVLLADSTQATGNKWASIPFPTRATMWGDEGIVVAGNTGVTIAIGTSQLYSAYAYQTTPANGDARTWGMYLAAGTYTFKVLGTLGNNQGKSDYYIDGTLVASGDDWYAASGSSNAILTHSSITVSGNGWHQFKIVVNGKNASSSNYFMVVGKIWFYQSADTANTI